MVRASSAAGVVAVEAEDVEAELEEVEVVDMERSLLAVCRSAPG
jgi:hypothetical protein